jgi:hypothetical protein
MTATVEITGNTYPVREKLKALGGRAVKRGMVWVWLVPADKAEQARQIVEAAPKARGQGQAARGPRTCATWRCRINYGVYCGKCEFGR